MLKLRIIVYVVVLVVMGFCLRRVLSEREIAERDVVAVAEETGERETSFHVTLSEYVGRDGDLIRFRVIRYLQYDSRGNMGAEMVMEPVFDLKEESEEMKEMAERLKEKTFVLLCWNGVADDSAKDSGRESKRLVALKELTDEEKAELGRNVSESQK